MDATGEDRYRCKHLTGFFLRTDGKMTSPQFCVFNSVAQTGRVVVACAADEDTDVGARLVLIHRSPYLRRDRVLGFTTEKNEKMEYFYAGDLPFGKILLVPVQGHSPTGVPPREYPYEDYVTLLKDDLTYTGRAEEALDVLFVMLDADSNGYLSSGEVSVLKGYLGFGWTILEDEWSDILFGWKEGDLDHTLTEMSASFFRRFILRLCQGHFAFFGGTDAMPPQIVEYPYSLTGRSRATRYLERIFSTFGFDKDLTPSGSSRFSVRIYTESYSLSRVTVLPRGKVNSEKAVTVATGVFGKKWRNPTQGLVIYVLECADWFSVSVQNSSDGKKRITVDCSGSVGALPFDGGLVRAESVPEGGETLAIRLARVRQSREAFQVHCDVAYESQNGSLSRVSLT